MITMAMDAMKEPTYWGIVFALLGAALAFFYQTMEIRLRRRQHQYRKARK